MVDFIRYGGFNMWVLIAVGVALLITAVKFARNADPQRLSLIRALTWALAFSTIAGFASGLMMTCLHVVRDDEMLKQPLPNLLQGTAESLTNVILGAGIGFATWILVAVGVRRMPRDPAA
jgi:hypothetical protein